MEFPVRKWVISFTVLIYLLVVAGSVHCLVLKRESLQFHTRDYNYFIEQAARLTDPQMAKEFALNIEGYNFLGLQGLEGVQSLYHAIHAEYFRYTYVVLYGVFQDTLPIYIFYSLIFFSPILYFAVLQPFHSREDWKPVLLFVLLFVLFPAAFTMVTYDLRPRVLFISAWCLVIMAVYFDRPFLEKLAFFGLLLGIREEGILLGAIVIVLNFLYMDGKPGRWMQTIVLLLLDALALAAFLAFMAWGGYNRVDPVYDPLVTLGRLFAGYLPYIIVAAGLSVLLLAFFWFKKREQFNHLPLLLVYAGGIALSGAQVVRETIWWYGDQSQAGPVTAWDAYFHFVTDSPYALVFYMCLLLLVLLWSYLQNRSRRLLLGLLAFLCLIFAATSLANTQEKVAEWRQNIPSARLVWDFVESHDRYHTDVLVDYDTYQAFYHFDSVIVYNRLPLWDTVPEKRYYPQNKNAIVKQIQQGMDFAVISRLSLENVLEMATMAGVRVTEVGSNDRYVVLELGDR